MQVRSSSRSRSKFVVIFLLSLFYHHHIISGVLDGIQGYTASTQYAIFIHCLIQRIACNLTNINNTTCDYIYDMISYEINYYYYFFSFLMKN
jgi:hypothetical protein